MFFVELSASFAANSESLKADALDFLADTISYVVTLFVLNRSEVARNKSAAFKGWLMLAMGTWVLSRALYKVWAGVVPEAEVMGLVGFVALIANLSVAFLLFRFRGRDMNMQSVWLCSRNDAFANVAVMLAAGGVWATATRWPDLIVAAIISFLNVSAGYHVLKSLKQNAQVKQCCG